MTDTTIGKGVVEVEMRDTGVEAGVARIEKSLDTLGVRAKAAGQTAADGVGQIPASTESAEKRIEASTRSIANAIQRQIAMLEAGNKTTSEYYTLLAQQRGVDPSRLKPYLEQLDQVNSRQRQSGITAGEMSNAMRTLPAQFTDIATSLAGGQNPMLVFIQQGGQIKDMFGGTGAAAKAMGQYIMGLVNPFTIAAAAAAVLSYSLYAGSRESRAFADALIMTNNAAGATADQLETMAARMDELDGTRAASAEAITALVATGKVSADNLEKFAVATMKWSAVTGEAVADVVGKFEQLGKDPVGASLKLDESLRHLTASTYEQVKALIDQGRETDAANLAQLTFFDTLSSRTGEMEANLGIIERSWIAIKQKINEAGDALLDFGRKQTYQDQLDAIDRKLKSGFYGGTRRDGMELTEGDRAALIQERKAIELAMSLDRKTATVQGENEANRRAGLNAQMQFNKLLESGASKAQKMAKELAEVDRWAKALAADGKPLSDAQIAQAKSIVAKKYEEKPKQARTGLSAGDGALASIEADIAARRREIDLFFSEDSAVRQLTATQEKLLEVQERLRKAKTDAQRAPLLQQEIKLQELKEVEAQLTALDELKAATDDWQNSQAEYTAQLVQDAATRNASIRTESESIREQIIILGMSAGQIAQRKVALAEEALSKAEAAGESELYLEQLRGEVRLRKAVVGDTEDLEKARRDPAKALNSAIEDYARRATDGAAAIQSVFGVITKGMEDNLTKFFMTGKAGWKDFANSVVEQIVRIQIQKAIAGGLDAFKTTDISKTISSFFASANGNAFAGGQPLTAFATGGAFTNTIATAPTVAPMALFGEAGPEAIMPLARDSSGRLGVRSSSEGTQAVAVSVNVTNASSQPVNATASQPKWDGKQWVIGVMLEDVKRGGPVSTAFENAYRLRRG
ncbi:phage tail length tape measure family protein [Vogesella sp. XCS3]|uniref:phage tail length tape measure family protein n=1 Tax=Vogesella sp. XCS3 TaxID=2877939 RepID=UPI001D0B6EC1|nr:phage tail length tape measure family protein [Vogesella sp. XCS3]UDM17929.1 phage tail length tape measure family protein [Vogesella sp. XCS3]